MYYNLRNSFSAKAVREQTERGPRKYWGRSLAESTPSGNLPLVLGAAKTELAA